MAKGNGKKSKSEVDVAVKFGGVSIGQETARIGVTFDRGAIDLVKADEVFCGHRLTGRVVLGNRDDAPGQQQLVDTDFEVEGSFDCKKLSVSAGQIGTGLTFSLKDIDISDFAKFSKGSGRLIVEHVAEIPENAPAEHDEDKDEKQHVPGSLTVEGDPKRTLMSRIFKGKILKALEGAGINDVERLGNFTESGKKISEIDGIGPGNAEVIGETMANFWSDNVQQGFELRSKKK